MGMMEIQSLVEQQGEAVEAFKAMHTRELDEIKANLRAMEVKAGRPGMAADGYDAAAGITSEDLAHKSAFVDYVRGGEEAAIKAIEAKAFSTTGSAGADGGFAIPKVIDQQVQSVLRASGSLRQVANVITVPSGYRKLVSVHGAGAAWVGETAARPETATPQLVELTPNWGELYANPMATQWMLDDALFNMENWLAQELAEEFTLAENPTFITGNGTNRPRGILNYTFVQTTDATRAFGQLESIKTGVNGGFAASNPSDILVTMIYRLAAPYRPNASWVMNANTINIVRQWKDSTGRYLWVDGLQQGQPATLLGYPVYELADMPDVGTGNIPILFGDFQRGYMICDRQFGTRVLRDPYSNKPYVGFYTTRRVGGMVVDSRAIKGILTSV